MTLAQALLGVEGSGSFSILLFVMILFSGIFSGSEIALVSLSPARVRTMIDRRLSGAWAVQRLKRNPNRMLITILVGNNAVNIGASVLTTTWATQAFGSRWLGAVTGVLTLLLLVFGEILPKTMAQTHNEGFARLIALPILVLSIVLYPLNWILERFVAASSKLFRPREDTHSASLAELQAMARIAADRGTIDAPLHGIVSGAFTFSSKKVADIMTPRTHIAAADRDMSIQDLRHVFLESGRSRIPIYEGSIDRVLGIADMRALLRGEEDGRGTAGELDLVPALDVTPDLDVDDLLIDFQEARQHLALVVGSQRETVGLVTLENVLEELVGEIFDEKDRFKVFVRRLEKNVWEVRGDCTVDELRKTFREFEPQEPPFKSIASIFQERSGKEPFEGCELACKLWVLQVTRMDAHVISRIRVTRT